METGRIKELFKSRNYEEKYFDIFLQVWKDEYSDGEFPAEEADENAVKYMDYYLQQIKLGCSEKWAADYASTRLYSINAGFITDENLIEEMRDLNGRPEEADVKIFVNSLDKDQNFKYAFIEAFKMDILSAPERMSLYDFAEQYSQQYSQLIKEGYSDNYVKAYLMVCRYDDIYCVPATIYASIYETAMKNGMSFDDAYDFTDDLCYHSVDVCDILRKWAEDNVHKYTQSWQQPLIIDGLAYALANFGEVKHVEDFVEICRSYSNISDMMAWKYNEWCDFFNQICKLYYEKYEDEKPLNFE